MAVIKKRRRAVRVAVRLLVVGAVAVAGERLAAANTIAVNTTVPDAVDGRCGLMEAIRASRLRAAVDACGAGNGFDTITLGRGTFSLGAAQPMEIWSDQITFQGAGMNETIISSASIVDPSFPTGMTSADCDFRQAATYISTSSVVNFVDLTLQGAADTMGVCVTSGSLTITRSRVTNFFSRGIFAVYSPSSNGGAVFLNLDHALIDHNHCYNDGWGGAGVAYGEFQVPGGLEIHHSTISNNTSEDVGGGLSVIGDQFANRHMTNTTISDNVSVVSGGGLYLAIESYFQLDFVTIAFNRAPVGGGIFKSAATGNFQLTASIVTDNIADSDAQQANLNPVAGGNSISCIDTLIYLTGSEWPSAPLGFSNNCEYGTVSGGLGSLVGKGGTNNLPVRPLLAGSHGIDKVFNDTISDDERDLARPIDGDGNGTKVYDRGAFELHPQQLEAESLTVAAKSTDTHSLSSSGQASGGSLANLQSNAVNDFVTYRTPTLTAGTYSVAVRYKKGSNAGRFQLARADTVSGTYTNVGPSQDAYAANTTWSTVTLGNITITAGQKFLRLLVTGKNASSSSFLLFPDYIDLIKQ